MLRRQQVFPDHVPVSPHERLRRVTSCKKVAVSRTHTRYFRPRLLPYVFLVSPQYSKNNLVLGEICSLEGTLVEAQKAPNCQQSMQSHVRTNQLCAVLLYIEAFHKIQPSSTKLSESYLFKIKSLACFGITLFKSISELSFLVNF